MPSIVSPMVNISPNAEIVAGVAIVKKDAKVPEGTWIRSGVIYE